MISEIIYLQINEDPYDEYSNGATWCEDRINDSDIEYILKSKYDELGKQNEKLITKLKLFQSEYDYHPDVGAYIELKEIAEILKEHK